MLGKIDKKKIEEASASKKAGPVCYSTFTIWALKREFVYICNFVEQVVHTIVPRKSALVDTPCDSTNVFEYRKYVGYKLGTNPSRNKFDPIYLHVSVMTNVSILSLISKWRLRYVV